MGGGVGGVVKLAGHPGRRQGGEQFVRLGDGALHALGAGGEHQLSPQGGQEVPPLQAHGFRHGEDDAVAPNGRNVGKTYAGVPAGGLHDDGVRLQKASGLGVTDHIEGRPVLGGGEGIEGLQLGQDVGAGGVTVQGKQGGVADQIGEHRGDFHSIPSNLV